MAGAVRQELKHGDMKPFQEYIDGLNGRGCPSGIETKQERDIIAKFV